MHISIRLLFFCALLGHPVLDAAKNEKICEGANLVDKGIATLSVVATYLCSLDGIKDAGAAYGLAMGLTTVHELSHALVAKFFYGASINVTVGATSASMYPYLNIGGLTLGGFNPATGYSRYDFYAEDAHVLKEAAVCCAGPIGGSVASLLAYLLLRKSEGWYLTKCVSLFGLFNHTLGIAGLCGALVSPRSDLARAIACLKYYYSSGAV